MLRLVVGALLVLGISSCGGAQGTSSSNAPASKACPAGYATSKDAVAQDITVAGQSGTQHVGRTCVSSSSDVRCGIGPDGSFAWSMFSPDAHPPGQQLSLSLHVSAVGGESTYTVPKSVSASLALFPLKGGAKADQMLWSSSAGSVTINPDQKSGTLNLLLGGNTHPDPANHLVATTGTYHVYGAFQCLGGAPSRTGAPQWRP